MEELLAKMAGLLQDIYDEGHGGEFRSSIQDVLVRYNASQQSLAPDAANGDGIACPICGEKNYCIHRDN